MLLNHLKLHLFEAGTTNKTKKLKKEKN